MTTHHEPERRIFPQIAGIQAGIQAGTGLHQQFCTAGVFQLQGHDERRRKILRQWFVGISSILKHTAQSRNIIPPHRSKDAEWFTLDIKDSGEQKLCLLCFIKGHSIDICPGSNQEKG